MCVRALPTCTAVFPAGHAVIDQCSTLNFARRDQCFGCGAAAGGGFGSSIPTNVLRVSRLRRSITVEQVCDIHCCGPFFVLVPKKMGVGLWLSYVVDTRAVSLLRFGFS